MEVIGLEVSKYAVSFTSYFADIYLPMRTIYLAVIIVVVLRVAKAIRKAAK